MGIEAIHNGGGGGGGISEFMLSASCRFYQYNDNRWTGPNDFYGSLDQNFNQAYGLGVDPVPTADGSGFGVLSGQSLKGLIFEADSSTAEITAINIALTHRSAVDGSLALMKKYSNQAITLTKAAGLRIYDRTLSIPFPSDGQLFLSVQPVGVLSVTAYVKAGFSLIVG